MKLKIAVDNPSSILAMEEAQSLKKWIEDSSNPNIENIEQKRSPLNPEDAGGLLNPELIMEIVASPEVVASVITGVFTLLNTWLKNISKDGTSVKMLNEDGNEIVE